jgi:hypothetical protein
MLPASLDHGVSTLAASLLVTHFSLFSQSATC